MADLERDGRVSDEMAGRTADPRHAQPAGELSTGSRTESGRAYFQSAVPATPVDNVAVANALYEAFNARDFDRMAALTADGCEVVAIAFGQTFHGPAGMRAYMQNWITGFPDGRVEITHVIASGGNVVTEFVGRGTHTASLGTPAGELKATGRAAELPVCDVIELKDGKVERLRTYFDAATLLRQLGLGG
jgi:steroid delta-isomerase-like uncharacterized protein